MTKQLNPAKLTIRRAAKMTPKGRQAISDWLYQQAEMLRCQGDNYAPVFTANYVIATSNLEG